LEVESEGLDPMKGVVENSPDDEPPSVGYEPEVEAGLNGVEPGRVSVDGKVLCVGRVDGELLFEGFCSKP
jgi:hypothetical protein